MPRPLLALALLWGLSILSGAPSGAAVGGELGPLEERVRRQPRDLEARRELAQEYAARGFVEEAAAQYLALLEERPEDAEAAARLAQLVQQRMPAWLPKGADKAPLTAAVYTLSLPGSGDPAAAGRVLISNAFEAQVGERRDALHGWLYSRLLYGYIWDQAQQRWLMKARAHFVTRPDLAGASLYTVLALLWLVQEQLRLDPSHASRRPVEVWLAEKGQPGAQTVGRDIYLYAVGTERAPEEWLREVAHECGHAALPGLGGFAKTDDAWADGELGELLFVKWLAAGQAERFPWSAPAAEAVARVRRDRLIARAVAPDPHLLAGGDGRARDHLLGLALRVEASVGPRFLGEVLSRCPQGTAAQFVVIAKKLAKERGVTVGW